VKEEANLDGYADRSSGLVWPEVERIYWLTNAKPELPARPIGTSTVWRFPFAAHTHHPAPFAAELPEGCVKAVGRPGITVLDPLAGCGTTIAVALHYGYKAIYIDISKLLRLATEITRMDERVTELKESASRASLKPGLN
jgi:hypothetical protein